MSGWKLVPIEPIQDQWNAAYKEQPEAINVGFAQAYRTMVANAPPAPVPPAAEPFIWICLVAANTEGDADPDPRIRAWTANAARAAQLAEQGLDMVAVYRNPAAAQSAQVTDAMVSAGLDGWFSVKPTDAESDAVLEQSMRAALVAALASQPSPAATVETVSEPKDLAELLRRVRDGSIDAEADIIEMFNARRKELAQARSSAASEVPFLTGEALRKSLRGSDCLAAEAEVNGRSEEEELERLVEIAEQAKRHWLATNPVEPQAVPDYETAARALGFQKMPSGRWWAPNPHWHVTYMCSWDTAEQIFETWGGADISPLSRPKSQ